MSIAEQLLLARRRAGLTQKALSEKSGVKLSLVGDIERERNLSKLSNAHNASRRAQHHVHDWRNEVKIDTDDYCRTITGPKPAPYRWVGIDPGASGGIVAIYKSGDVVCDKMPATTADLVALLKDYWGSPCYIEKVGPGPKMGSSAAWKFGRNCGNIEAAALAAAMEVHYVAPQKWQKEYSLIVSGRGLGQDDTSKKNRNKARAQELFPREKVCHWNADALLLAELCRRQQSN